MSAYSALVALVALTALPAEVAKVALFAVNAETLVKPDPLPTKLDAVTIPVVFTLAVPDNPFATVAIPATNA